MGLLSIVGIFTRNESKKSLSNTPMSRMLELLAYVYKDPSEKSYSAPRLPLFLKVSKSFPAVNM